MFNSPAFVVYYLEAPSLNAGYNVFMVFICYRSRCTHLAITTAIKGEINLLENEKSNELRAIHPLNELKYIPFPTFPVL